MWVPSPHRRRGRIAASWKNPTYLPLAAPHPGRFVAYISHTSSYPGHAHVVEGLIAFRGYDPPSRGGTVDQACDGARMASDMVAQMINIQRHQSGPQAAAGQRHVDITRPMAMELHGHGHDAKTGSV